MYLKLHQAVLLYIIFWLETHKICRLDLGSKQMKRSPKFKTPLLCWVEGNLYMVIRWYGGYRHDDDVISGMIALIHRSRFEFSTKHFVQFLMSQLYITDRCDQIFSGKQAFLQHCPGMALRVIQSHITFRSFLYNIQTLDSVDFNHLCNTVLLGRVLYGGEQDCVFIDYVKLQIQSWIFIVSRHAIHHIVYTRVYLTRMYYLSTIILEITYRFVLF